jgi:CheY-like chemotaxis protein
MAEDDPDDRLLVREAFEESRLLNELRFVEDGEELLDYLRRQKGYADPESAPKPGLILLDLNMPRKDGREALREIKADPQLRHGSQLLHLQTGHLRAPGGADEIPGKLLDRVRRAARLI